MAIFGGWDYVQIWMLSQLPKPFIGMCVTLETFTEVLIACKQFVLWSLVFHTAALTPDANLAAPLAAFERIGSGRPSGSLFQLLFGLPTCRQKNFNF